MVLAFLVAVVIVAGVTYVRTDSFGHLLKGHAGNLLAYRLIGTSLTRNFRVNRERALSPAETLALWLHVLSS